MIHGSWVNEELVFFKTIWQVFGGYTRDEERESEFCSDLFLFQFKVPAQSAFSLI